MFVTNKYILSNINYISVLFPIDCDGFNGIIVVNLNKIEDFQGQGKIKLQQHSRL